MTTAHIRTAARFAARPDWRLWLAALAVFVQVLLPVQVLRAAGVSGDPIVLCSAAGKIAGDTAALDGGPISDAGHKTGMVCPLCAGAGGAALPPGEPQAGLEAPAEFAGIRFALADDTAESCGGSAAYGSRAPPVSV